MNEPPTFSPNETLSLLIHAGSKVGKTSLTATAPKPLLALDAEGSWKFIPARKVYWSPYSGAPPEYDGTWDVCIVNVPEWSTVQLVANYLRQYQTPFVSLSLDSITEVQRRCRMNLKGTDLMKIQDWGNLLVQMDSTIRGFRDLMFIEGLNIRCVMFVAETRHNMQTNKWVPYMQGQISISLPYWMDIVGYMYSDWEQDLNGQRTEEIRRLWIGQSANFETGERVQGRLGTNITIPKPPPGEIGSTISDMMCTVYNKEPCNYIKP